MNLNNLNLSPDKYDALLKMASQKLGTNPDQLKNQLESGQLDGLMNKLDPKTANQINAAIQNPKVVEQLLGNDKVRDALGKVLGDKK